MQGRILARHRLRVEYFARRSETRLNYNEHYRAARVVRVPSSSAWEYGRTAASSLGSQTSGLCVPGDVEIVTSVVDTSDVEYVDHNWVERHYPFAQAPKGLDTTGVGAERA